MKEEQMHSPEYFNTKQAAQRYGLSASWLSKLRVFGGGSPYLKIGRRVVYERSAFEKWLASHRRASTSARAEVLR
jgi:predicted DNA-binding transcriptional regulator AlpA